MLKNIVKNLKPSSTLKINEVSKELESKGKKIYKFGFGQSPFEVPDDVVNELKNNAHQNKIGYVTHITKGSIKSLFVFIVILLTTNLYIYL